MRLHTAIGEATPVCYGLTLAAVLSRERRLKATLGLQVGRWQFDGGDLQTAVIGPPLPLMVEVGARQFSHCSQ